jgi:hypothetical protein
VQIIYSFHTIITMFRFVAGYTCTASSNLAEAPPKKKQKRQKLTESLETQFSKAEAPPKKKQKKQKLTGPIETLRLLSRRNRLINEIHAFSPNRARRL